MGLGNRNARRHDTEGTRKTAGVRSEDYWDFAPGQTVMTVDGFLGTVEAVNDGPVAGTEEYTVRLLNDMGGGLYTSSQLRAATTTTAAAEAANTAAKDYPELAEILQRRPDPGKYPSSTLGMVASREDPQTDREAMKYHGRDDVTELREDMGLPPLEAAYYTEDDLREIGREEERRTGKTAAELLAEHVAQQEQHFAAGGQPGLCENGHLTWGGDCPACRNADDGDNAMVTNPGDHKPQDVENVKNASVHEDPLRDDEGGPYHRPGSFDDDHEYDEDEPDEPMVHCPACGQWKGKYSDNHPGNDGPCPAASPSEDEVFDSLDPSKYCGEHCQSAHASDIVQGVGGHHTFRADEPEYAGHGTGLANTTSPYDAPASRDSRYEVRDPDEAGLCRYCRKPLMGSPLDQLDQIGTPAQEHYLRTNPTGPTKYSAVQTTPIEQTHTRTIPEDDDFDSYLITRCGDHGTKIVGDRPSQEVYIEAAKACHDASYHEGMSHKREHDYDGSDCWSCCPDMYVAKPGERESGRTASLRFGLAMIALAQSDPDLGFHLTAAWRDVRDKAKRIRTEGGVHITTAQNGYVIAQVKGDHGTYEAVLMRVPGTQKVGQWDCGCKWATYHWGAPDDYSRFAGRMCSHALALNFEAQSRGMFGREVTTDQGVPRWLNQGQFERTASTGDDLPFLSVFATLAIAEGQHPDEVARIIASVNSPFGEPGPNPVPHYPATMPKNPSENPASAGFLTAADPAGWSQSNSPDLADRMASRDDDSIFEPEMGKEAFLPLLLEALPAIAEGVGGAGAAAGAGEAAAGGEAAGGSSLLKGVTKLPGLPGTSAPSGGGESSPTKQVHQWAQQDKAEGDAARQQQDMDFNERIKNFQATLHDEPEPALPSTDGSAEDDEDLFGPQVTASVSTGVEYSVPTDAGNSIPTPASPAPGLKDVADDALSPEDPSMATVGSLSGGVDDIVAQFQRTAGAAVLGNSTGTYEASIQANSEIAAAARQFLQTGEPPMAKEAMAVFSPAEQQALINEGEGVKAANLDRLQIEGTHYEALDAALAKQDGDDEEWMD